MLASSSTFTGPETPTCEVPSKGILEISLLPVYRGYSITPSTDSNAHVTHSNALARSSAAILSGKTRVAGVSVKL